MANTSQDAAIEAEILLRAHRILDKLGDETVFSSYDEFRLHASAFFVATLQLKLKLKFPNVNRSPVSFEDHRFNAQVFIDAVRRYLQTALTDVEPELICVGDYNAILKCIEVIESLDDSNPAVSISVTDNAILSFDDTRENLLESWNRLMDKFQLPKLSSLNELQVNASSIATLIVEAAMGKCLKGIVRRPLLKKDYSINARLAMEAICIYCGKELDSSKLAEQLVAGDLSVLTLFPKLISMAPKCPKKEAVQSDSDKVTESRSKIQSSNIELHSKPLNRPELLQRQKIVAKQLRALTARNQSESEYVTEHVLKNLSRLYRHEQIWNARQDQDFSKDEATLRKLHNESFQYEVCKTFAKALKVEKEYQRVQHDAFTERLRKLHEQWNNKKISTERFFNDKYEMFLTEIKHATARRKSDEIQARTALIKMKKEFRIEQRKRLEFLKQQLLEKDRNSDFLKPQKFLKWLLKIPAN